MKVGAPPALDGSPPRDPGPRIDPGVKYPPYAEHTSERKVMERLL
jgi:hypothetical protein